MPRLCAAFLIMLAASAQPSLELLVDSTVERARREFDVPGMSVAVIKDGAVVLAKGYGVRRLGSPDRMTEQTLVGIASNTKVFASAALAMLVDEKKLSWDDRVIDKLPEFAMSDAYVTREMRIRDLPCHRSGLALGAGDLMFWPSSDLSAADILYRLRFVPITGQFRAGYAYDNILYNVMGALVERISGKPWDQFIRERFFEPLGMKSSLTSIRLVKDGDNVAAPHAVIDGVLAAQPHAPLDNVAAAGALVSSASDMTRWVMTLLNKGVTPEGKRLLSEEQASTLWAPLVLVGGRSNPPDEIKEAKTNFSAYAMGQVLSEYRGEFKVAHTGGLLGMVTSVTMLPDQKLGVIVLTNQQEVAAFRAVENTILDHFLKAPQKDWVAAWVAQRKKVRGDATKAVTEAAGKRNAATKPSLPLTSYTGRYRDAWYGDVIVTESDGRLAMQFSHSRSLTGTLEHWQYDTFIVRWTDRSLEADAYVTFQLGPQAKIEEVKMAAVSPLTDFSFDFHHLRLTPVPADASPWD